MGIVGLAGCKSSSTTTPGSEQADFRENPKSTDIDPKTASPEYWLSQNATSELTFGDFQKLWDGCESVAFDYLFRISRRDYRGGLLTTEPMVSKQWFEPWRKDSTSTRDVEENSLGGIRRAIYFQFAKNPDGSYTVAPKVLVERQTKMDPKHTSPDEENTQYWFAIRRDATMEIRIVGELRKKLGLEM
jgi:hypothetical protein